MTILLRTVVAELPGLGTTAIRTFNIFLIRKTIESEINF